MSDVVKNYVKFMRGTPTAFKNLATKDDDTLYFISVEGEEVGQLWIGNKLITMSTTADGLATYLDELQDVETAGAENGNFLGWDTEKQLWVPKSLVDAISEMGGLVDADQKSIVADDQNILSLKDFGKVYYRYVAEEKDEEGNVTVEAGYVKQEVDADHPWKEGLEPKVVLDNENLVLGWYEPNSSEFDALKERVEKLEEVAEGLDARVDEVEADVSNLGSALALLGEELGEPATEEAEASGVYALIDQKANSEDVYTKEEADEKFAVKGATLAEYGIEDAYTKTETEAFVNKAVLDADHLKRIIVDSVDDIDPNGEKADQFIYMVPVATEEQEVDDKFDEYMVIDGKVEKVGSWKVDLGDYLTIESFNTTIEDYYTKTEITDLIKEITGGESAATVKAQLEEYISSNDAVVENITDKLNTVEEGAEVNVINEVSPEFKIVTDEENNIDRRLELVSIDVTKISNLDSLLNTKADKTTVEEISKDVQQNKTDISDLSGKVDNLEATLSNYVAKTEFEQKMSAVDSDLAAIKDILTWKSLDDVPTV